MTYQQLTANDIRQPGDEYRDLDTGDVIDTVRTFFDYRSNTWKRKPYKRREPSPGPWKPVKLVGHLILHSDLLHLEYRRHV